MRRACAHTNFSTLYTTLPHYLIKDKPRFDSLRVDLQKASKLSFFNAACNDRKAFFTSSDEGRYTLCSCQNVCDALSYHLDNIYIRFGIKLYRHILENPLGTNSASLVADLFSYCYEKDFRDPLNHVKPTDDIKVFNLTFYL